MKTQNKWRIDYNQLQEQMMEARHCLTAIRGDNRKGSVVCIIKAIKTYPGSDTPDKYSFAFRRKNDCPKWGAIIPQQDGSIIKILRIIE